MDSNAGGYELLNFIWFEGYKPCYFDGEGRPIHFPTLAETLAELQDDFDTVAREIADGEREPDCGFSPEEFEIRCVETGERFAVESVDGRVQIKSN